MNGEKNELYALDADSLRETLGYSMQFRGKLFCVAVDAECFKEYNCNQIVQDILLVVRSCNVKIFIVVGWFPSRPRGKKKKMMEDITVATGQIEKCFGQFATTVKIADGFDDSLASQINAALKKQSVAIVPAVVHKGSEAVAACEIERILSSLGGSVEQDQISKLVVISCHDGIFDESKQLFSQICSGRLQELLSQKTVTGEFVSVAKTALSAIEKGIKRVHMVNGTKSGSLLVELFTKDGSGTMIYSGPYIEVRQALPDDLGSIHDLMSRHTDKDVAFYCSDKNVEQFLVGAIDDYVIACARLRSLCEEGKLLISSLMVNPDYPEIGLELLAKASETVASQKNARVLLAVFRPIPWWIPSDFQESDISQLPKEVQKECAGKPVVLLSKNIS